MSSIIAPIVFIPHGGGPMPLLNEPNHRSLIHFLKNIGAKFGKPRAILVISAHWEAEITTISSTANPDLIYDYSGFPPESYQLTYPAPGNPELAHHVNKLINGHGPAATTNAKRGFDHGTFVPLTLMYPLADIPVVQLSLVNTLDAQHHIEIGKAIGKLREQGVLIIGSGFSFHNMNALQLDSKEVAHKSQLFDTWLNHVVTSDALSLQQKEDALIHWKQAPEALFSHPREEHLLPLHVCFGAAVSSNATATNVFDDSVFDAKVSAFLWQ